MTSRAGRHLAYFGFAAVIGVGLQSSPVAAQSYLADNGSGSVTVDYSVLGQGAGPSPINRAPLPGGAMPVGACSCANAPMGVIAAAPRPTFTNPFGNQPVAQAPAVPPGFMAYNQAVGSSSSGSAVVLRPPSGATSEMAQSEPAPMEEAQPAPVESTNDAMPSAEPLSKTTPTQSESQPAGSASTAAPSGGETPPAPAEAMPTDVPSPVQPPAGSTTMQAAEKPAEVPTEQPSGAAPATEAQPTPETPPPSSAATSTQEAQPEGEQQAAVTPAAPTDGTTPPADSGGALPAGATRILYTGESDDVPAASTGEIDKIAQDLLANQDKRIQVMSYAAGTEDMESKARRKSLARGLAIRSYLIKAGVPSTRIDVRALGNKAEGGPADRVDIIPAS